MIQDFIHSLHNNQFLQVNYNFQIPSLYIFEYKAISRAIKKIILLNPLSQF